MRKVSGIMLLIAVMGCAHAPVAIDVQTPSGKAEAICEGSVPKVRDMLVNRAVVKGWDIRMATGTMVRQMKRLGEPSESIQRILRGDGDRYIEHTWLLLKAGEGVRVVGSSYLLTHRPNGAVQKMTILEGLGENMRNHAINDGLRALADMGCLVEN